MLKKAEINTIIETLNEYKCNTEHQYNVINDIISVLQFVTGEYVKPQDNTLRVTHADILNHIIGE